MRSILSVIVIVTLGLGVQSTLSAQETEKQAFERAFNRYIHVIQMEFSNTELIYHLLYPSDKSHMKKLPNNKLRIQAGNLAKLYLSRTATIKTPEMKAEWLKSHSQISTNLPLIASFSSEQLTTLEKSLGVKNIPTSGFDQEKTNCQAISNYLITQYTGDFARNMQDMSSRVTRLTDKAITDIIFNYTIKSIALKAYIGHCQ